MVKRYKILMLNANPDGVGTFWRCFHIARNLPKYYDVTLTCFPSLRRESRRVEVRMGVKIYHVPSWRLLASMHNILSILIQKYDIIHAFAVARFPTGIPALFSKLCGRKLIVDWDDWWTKGGFYKLKISDLVHGLLEDGIPRLADAVTVVSDALMKRCFSIGIPRHKIFKVVNGANTDIVKPIPRETARSKLGLPKNNNYLLHMGFSIPEEMKTVLKALRLVVREIPNTKLIFIGKSPDPMLRRFIKNARLDNIIIDVGRIPYEALPIYLGASDILLLPMDEKITEIARFPIRLGDYLAAGRPILASDVGEAGRIVRDCGFTLRMGDVLGWSEKILNLLINKELNNLLGRKARNIAEKLSWSNIAHQVNNVYKIVQEDGMVG